MAEGHSNTESLAFTRINVLKATEGLIRLWGNKELAYRLKVPNIKKNGIQTDYSTLSEQRQQLIMYWMDWDPRASWRAMIVALDGMNETKLADAIREYAEPILDDTLTVDNVCQILLSVKDWHSLGCSGLEILSSVCDHIRDSLDYSTEEEKKGALIKYYLRTTPNVSWKGIATGLFRREEKAALKAVNDYLKDPKDSNPTSENLCSALELMEDQYWRGLGSRVCIPSPLLNEISSEHVSDKERKMAVIDLLATSHPAPTWLLVAHALYQMYGGDDSCHKALRHLQSKFPTGRYYSRQIYEKEMQQGYRDLGLDKIVMFGIAGSGKTCSLAALLGVDAPAVRSSTPLMQRPIEVMIVHIDDDSIWERKTTGGIQQNIAHVIRSRAPCNTQAAYAAATTKLSDSASLQHGKPTSESIAPIVTLSEETHSDDANSIPYGSKGGNVSASDSGLDIESKLDKWLKSSDMDEELISLVNSCSTSSTPIISQNWAYIIDSGGQPQFHEVLPVFLNSASRFVFVLKLNEPLNAKPKACYYDNGKLVWEEHLSYQTSDEIFKRCIQTMRSFNSKCKEHPPKIIILGTHRDMISDDNLALVLETIKQSFETILLPEFKDQLIFCNGSLTDFVFAINAKTPTDEDKIKIKSIRECLTESTTGRRVKVPLRWHKLERKLKEIAKNLELKVLTRRMCRKIANSLGIEEQSCEDALNFFHSLNLLFYYPDILPDLVFVEPQVLLDKVTELVEQMYRMQDRARNAQSGPISGEWLYFRDYGQVTEIFLNELNKHYTPEVFASKDLIKLFKGLLVFAELSDHKWFMPCLLQLTAPEDIPNYQESKRGALVVQFEDGGPRIGMFCCTVAYVLSSEHTKPWKIYGIQNQLKPKCLTRNVIIFQVPSYPGTVTLIDLFTHFEVHVITHSKKAEEMWKTIKETLSKGLGKAAKTLSYDDNGTLYDQWAIVCPCSDATLIRHHATFDNEGVWTCSKCSEVFGDIPDESIPWYKKPTPPSSPVKEFSLRNIFNELNGVGFSASNWNKLGLQLEVPQNQLDIFEEDVTGSENRLIKTIDYWMHNDIHASWETLADALSQTPPCGSATVSTLRLRAGLSEKDAGRTLRKRITSKKDQSHDEELSAARTGLQENSSRSLCTLNGFSAAIVLFIIFTCYLLLYKSH